MYTMKMAQLYMLKKSFVCLTNSNEVQNVSAGQTATKFQSLSLQANLDMQTNGTQHKLERRMH